MIIILGVILSILVLFLWCSLRVASMCDKIVEKYDSKNHSLK